MGSTVTTFTPIQRRTMYRHQEATGRKQPAWGGTDSWEEEVIEGDPCPLTAQGEPGIPFIEATHHDAHSGSTNTCS